MSDSSPPAEQDSDGAPPQAARFTLQKISSALARLRGPAPADAPAAPPSPAVAVDEPLDADEALPVTPRSIVEGILFIGKPDGSPITSREIASHISDVSAGEVDAIIADLNETYRRDGAAYEIVSDGPGYRLQLRDDLDCLRERLRGRTRAARLTPAAVEVLSIIAYRQPVTGDEVTRLRGAQSQAILRQLVRRQLVRLERPSAGPKAPLYRTTERFNALFGLSSLGDLPRDEDLDDS